MKYINWIMKYDDIYSMYNNNLWSVLLIVMHSPVTVLSKRLFISSSKTRVSVCVSTLATIKPPKHTTQRASQARPFSYIERRGQVSEVEMGSGRRCVRSHFKVSFRQEELIIQSVGKVKCLHKYTCKTLNLIHLYRTGRQHKKLDIQDLQETKLLIKIYNNCDKCMN